MALLPLALRVSVLPQVRLPLPVLRRRVLLVKAFLLEPQVRPALPQVSLLDWLLPELLLLTVVLVLPLALPVRRVSALLDWLPLALPRLPVMPLELLLPA